jgi:tripartite-type tricarboxylate transporter receptor subunit TctC
VKIRGLAWTVAFVSTAACAGPADGPWQPNRPIEFVVAAGPGGGSDQLARTVQAVLQKYRLVNRPIVVTNKGGGSGTEAFVYARGAAGDPHKVIFATNNVWLQPLATPVGYSLSDLSPVAVVALDEFFLWVKGDAPYADTAAFLNASRLRPGRMTMAGTASKDTDQVLVRQIEKVAGVTFTYVPFRSGNEVVVQLAGGHVAANTNNPQESIAQWKAGLVRPLCVFRPTRLPFEGVAAQGRKWADVPTCAESGLPIERYQMPRTVWLPKGVTDEQVTFYVDLLRRVRDTDEWKAWITRGSQSDEFLSGQVFTDYIAADISWLRAQFAEDGWLVN